MIENLVYFQSLSRRDNRLRLGFFGEMRELAGTQTRSGGARPGAGRKSGTTNIRTREIANKLISQDEVSALEVMALTMRALWAEAVDKGGKVVHTAMAKEACTIAEKVAPYMHPRLASIEQSIDTKVRHFAVSDAPLSEDEWDRTYGSLATTGRPSESLN